MKIIKCGFFEEQLSLPGVDAKSITVVRVIYQDGSREKLLSIPSGELSFTREDLIGLTREEARKRAKA